MAGDTAARYALLDSLADEFVARFRRGERPSLKVLTAPNQVLFQGSVGGGDNARAGGSELSAAL